MSIASAEEVTLVIKGMSCGGCAANVSRILSARSGVAGVAVDLAGGKATVKYRAAETSPAALAAAVTAAGYKAAVSG